MLSDEAKAKRDELAIEAISNAKNMDDLFQDGFDAGYEFAKSESKDLLVNCVLSAHGLKEKLDQERARTQKIVEALEEYNKQVSRLYSSDWSDKEAMQNLIYECPKPLKAHKAGE